MKSTFTYFNVKKMYSSSLDTLTLKQYILFFLSEITRMDNARMDKAQTVMKYQEKSQTPVGRLPLI